MFAAKFKLWAAEYSIRRMPHTPSVPLSVCCPPLARAWGELLPQLLPKTLTIPVFGLSGSLGGRVSVELHSFHLLIIRKACLVVSTRCLLDFHLPGRKQGLEASRPSTHVSPLSTACAGGAWANTASWNLMLYE